jgi:hypothetical protein
MYFIVSLDSARCQCKQKCNQRPARYILHIQFYSKIHDSGFRLIGANAGGQNN